MESAGEILPRSVAFAAKRRNSRTSSMSGEPAHVRFARDAAEVREFDVERIPTQASLVGTSCEDDARIEDDSPVYKWALRDRIRKARDQSIPVNEERALWRAERLRSKIETSDEKHLDFSSKRLALLRELLAAIRATSRTPDLHSPRGEVDLSCENDDVFAKDVANGQTAASSVHGVEPASPGQLGSADEGEQSHGNAKKSKIGVVWNSLSTSCTRAAQFTSKGLASVRRKTCFRGTSSKDSSQSGEQGRCFTRLRTGDDFRVRSLASIVPHQEA